MRSYVWVLILINRKEVRKHIDTEGSCEDTGRKKSSTGQGPRLYKKSVLLALGLVASWNGRNKFLWFKSYNLWPSVIASLAN